MSCRLLLELLRSSLLLVHLLRELIRLGVCFLLRHRLLHELLLLLHLHVLLVLLQLLERGQLLVSLVWLNCRSRTTSVLLRGRRGSERLRLGRCRGRALALLAGIELLFLRRDRRGVLPRLLVRMGRNNGRTRH